MLRIEIPLSPEGWDEEKQEFVATDDCGVTLNEFLKKKSKKKSKE